MNSSSSVIFHPGVNHSHKPCGRWFEIKFKPKSSMTLDFVCSNAWSPQQVVWIAKKAEFKNKPIALKHLNWYLVNGKGRTFNEDDNLKDMLIQDKGV